MQGWAFIVANFQILIVSGVSSIRTKQGLFSDFLFGLILGVVSRARALRLFGRCGFVGLCRGLAAGMTVPGRGGWWRTPGARAVAFRASRAFARLPG